MTPLSWTFSFRVIQATVQWHTFKTFMFVFINSYSLTFWGSRLLKYLINTKLIWLSAQNTRQNFHMAWQVILCLIGYIDVPNKGIEQACSLVGCDIHISPFSRNLHFSLSNISLVLVLNFIMYKSSYCKCSLAWCQVRTFLLFTIWTYPLQMRKIPAPICRYWQKSKLKKKSHYNSSFAQMWHILLWLSTAPSFCFYLIDFQLSTDFPLQVCVFFNAKSPSVTQRSISKENAFILLRFVLFLANVLLWKRPSIVQLFLCDGIMFLSFLFFIFTFIIFFAHS